MLKDRFLIIKVIGVKKLSNGGVLGVKQKTTDKAAKTFNRQVWEHLELVAPLNFLASSVIKKL